MMPIFVLNRYVPTQTRMVHVSRTHPLFELLDEGSRSGKASQRNYLVWSNNVKRGRITVCHFGPVGASQDVDLQRGFKSQRQKFWKDVWNNVSNGLISPGNLDSLHERDRTRAEKAIK